MNITTIRIDDRAFVLDESEDVEALKQRIVDAARAGAEFIGFLAADQRAVSVLITPTTLVRVETVERADTGPTGISATSIGGFREEGYLGYGD